DGEAADFHHPHRGAADLGKWRVKNQTAPLQQAESIEKDADAHAETYAAPEQKSGGVRLAKDQSREGHRRNPPGRLGLTPHHQASEMGCHPAAENAAKD